MSIILLWTFHLCICFSLNSFELFNQNVKTAPFRWSPLTAIHMLKQIVLLLAKMFISSEYFSKTVNGERCHFQSSIINHPHSNYSQWDVCVLLKWWQKYIASTPHAENGGRVGFLIIYEIFFLIKVLARFWPANDVDTNFRGHFFLCLQVEKRPGMFKH